MSGKIGKWGMIFFLSLLLLLLLIALAIMLVGGFFVLSMDTDIDDVLIESAKSDKTTRLYVRNEDGELLELSSERISGGENTLYCELRELPKSLVNAFIAIEDKRFYSHGGIDWLRTGSAVKEYLTRGSSSFGGSTITQQLVKNLTGENEKSIARKATELIRAAKIEGRYTKDEILEGYLNIVNLAENCYGVRTAANVYFSKEPRDLTLAESASIAAITNNPSKYNPLRHPDANRRRRDLILTAMYEQNMISMEEMQSAIAEDVTLNPSEKVLSGGVNSWYTDLVIHDVIRDLMKKKGISEAAAARLVYTGGVKIEICQDPRLQAILEEYYRENNHFMTGGKQAESGMIIADPMSGDILALVGAVGEKSKNRIQNYATDVKRPSGSVIKPLAIYAPAIERNLITYGSVFDDIPQSYRENGAPWPKNSPNIYRGLTTVNEALKESVNTVSVEILSRLGAKNSFDFLTKELNFYSLDQKKDMNAAALALGQQTYGVTLREMIGGYTALAGGGVFRETRSYRAVIAQNGEIILENQVKEKRVLSAETAEIMTLMLRHVVQSGTGKSLTLKEQVDAAGKTGTSSNSYDKWFLGYTPELLAGVWYGFEYPEKMAVKENPALTIFDEVMNRAVLVRERNASQFESSGELLAVRICKDSGALPGAFCLYDPRGDRTEIAYYKKGTEPKGHCTCHVPVEYCKGCGVSRSDCPKETRHTVALIQVKRSFKRQIYVLDATYTYDGFPEYNGQILSNNRPYYAENYNSNQCFGIGLNEIPFNRFCQGHASEDSFWDRRKTS